mgnify:CR=1 FL=1
MPKSPKHVCVYYTIIATKTRPEALFLQIMVRNRSALSPVSSIMRKLCFCGESADRLRLLNTYVFIIP